MTSARPYHEPAATRAEREADEQDFAAMNTACESCGTPMPDGPPGLCVDCRESMNAAWADAYYSFDGEEFRALVVGDVVALPNDAWSGHGYGDHISQEWLMHEGVLRALPARRRPLLARLIRRALADAHGYAPDPDCRAFVLREVRADSRNKVKA